MADCFKLKDAYGGRYLGRFLGEFIEEIELAIPNPIPVVQVPVVPGPIGVQPAVAAAIAVPQNNNQWVPPPPPPPAPLRRRHGARRYEYENGFFYQRGNDLPSDVVDITPCEEQASVITTFDPDVNVLPIPHAGGTRRSYRSLRSRRSSGSSRSLRISRSRRSSRSLRF